MRSKVATAVVTSGVFAFAVPAAVAQTTAAQDAYGGAPATQVTVLQPPAPTPVTTVPAVPAVPAVPEVRGVEEEAPEVQPTPEREAAPKAVAKPEARVAEVAQLPFTGLELGVAALLGSALLAAGIAGRLALRRGIRA
jgi:hypothetical protein